MQILHESFVNETGLYFVCMLKYFFCLIAEFSRFNEVSISIIFIFRWFDSII